MYSGYNLQGIIRRGTINTMHMFEKFGHYSQNVGNMNNNGYKAVRFDDVLNEQGYVTGAIRTNHAQGSFQLTQSPLDIAIKGAGYIPVTSAGGYPAGVVKRVYVVRKGNITFCF